MHNTIVVIFLVILLSMGCTTPTRKTVLKTENERITTNCSEEPKPSNLAQLIIKSTGLRSGRFHIPKAHVILQSPDFESDETSQSEDFEQVFIPSSVIMSDSFTYVLRIDHKTKRYWITRMGGISGSFEKYGPFQFKE